MKKLLSISLIILFSCSILLGEGYSTSLSGSTALDTPVNLSVDAVVDLSTIHNTAIDFKDKTNGAPGEKLNQVQLTEKSLTEGCFMSTPFYLSWSMIGSKKTLPSISMYISSPLSSGNHQVDWKVTGKIGDQSVSVDSKTGNTVVVYEVDSYSKCSTVPD